jgi:hypothetical protein
MTRASGSQKYLGNTANVRVFGLALEARHLLSCSGDSVVAELIVSSAAVDPSKALAGSQPSRASWCVEAQVAALAPAVRSGLVPGRPQRGGVTDRAEVRHRPPMAAW